MAVNPGTRIGRYEIIELIGAGGMGEVYRARDERLQRDVALKVLPEHDDMGVAARRFAVEARAIAALAHPNIINIFDFGAEGNRSYIAMELLQGETLRAVISRGVTPRRAVKIGEAVAEALRAAHAKGIAHRDLKPENIFIARDGTVKVLDFGLARVASSEVTDTSITKEGTIIGTVDYMSPEQVRGEPAGPSSDLFSLGCILFEMLGHLKPFARTSIAETSAAILRDDPPDLLLLRPELPEPLVRVVNRCLEKEPEQRFQSAADLAFALDAVGEATTSRPAFTERIARSPKASWVVPAILLILIAAVIVTGRRQRTGPAQSAAARGAQSIAILPLTNATGDPSLEYLSDGVTEGIINDLSPVFSVTARNSVFAYKGKNPEPREVRQKLNADVMLTGRLVQRAGTIQVGVELVDTRDGHQIWGRRFEQPMSDVAILESELSRTISQQLQITLSGADESRIAKRAAVNREAYRLYLQGRYEWQKRTPEGLRKGIEFFKQSIDIDPTYAPAHAGIADSYLLLGGNYELMPPREAMPMARQAAIKALELDDRLAEAHASLGVIDHEFGWNWPQAEADFKRAIELNPNYPVARQWYGHALIYRSRFDEGLQQLRKAEELDPLSLLTKADLSQALWIARRYDDAIKAAQEVIDIEPQFWLGYWFLGLAYAGKGQLPEAATALERAVELGGSAAAIGTLGYVYARQGRRADTQRLLRQLEATRKERYVSRAPFATVYIGMGNLDRTFAELEQAFNDRASLITVLNVVPIADPVRRDPRYIPFARRVGLPPVP
jgi:serine/threonine-protein kinase